MDINIESVNRILINMNKVNFLVSQIVLEIDKYILLEKYGQYELIVDENKIKQGMNNDSNCIVVYTSCLCNCTSTYNNQSVMPMVVMKDVILDKVWFTMSDEQLCQLLFERNLKRIQRYIKQEKDNTISILRNIEAGENLINIYINRGLEYEIVN